MVFTRINLKLIKCDFLLDFILFHFFKEIIKNVFLYGILSALLKKKKFGDMIHEKFKKKRKMLKKRHYLQQQLELHFWPKKRWNLVFSISIKIVENWISFQKKINPESIRILSRKLWPKYEIGAEDNTNSASSSIFFQNFKWKSTSNLFKLILLAYPFP